MAVETKLKTDPAELLQSYHRKMKKFYNGYQQLLTIDEVDVGTASKEEIFQTEKVRLYRYEPHDVPQQRTPTLIVYALVNRPAMLDLQPDRSLVRNLLDRGVSLYLIDWGYPDRSDRYLTLNDYINGYIDDCVEAIREQTGSDKVNLVGICQGGTFSIMYAALHPEKVKNLITMVTPFDFSVEEGVLFKWARFLDVDTIVDAFGVVPADYMNLGFMMVRPFGRLIKYVDFLEHIDDQAAVMNFLRMEKWIFDSPGQAGECYRQFIKDLYQQNKLIEGTLELDGRTVDVRKITMPLLNIYAQHDHLVPPASTIVLNDYVGSDDTELYDFKGGHIGLFVSSRTQKEVGPAIAAWLDKRDK